MFTWHKKLAIVLVLFSSLVPSIVLGDRIGVLINGAYYLDIGSTLGIFSVTLTTTPQGAALTTGDSQACTSIPYSVIGTGKNLVTAEAQVGTASSSGTPTFQVRRVRSGTSADMLSTRITIDANELTSSTATAAAVVDTANDDLADGDIVCIDVDVAGTGTLGTASVTLTIQ